MVEVADAKPSKGARPVAVAGLAAVRSPLLEVPVEWLTLATGTAGHLLLAAAQLALRHTGAAAPLEEVVRHALGVTVALFTQWEVKPLWGALVALDTHEVVEAAAVAVAVAGQPDGAEAVAAAHLAVGIAVVAGGAGVALPAPVVVEAGALAAHLVAHVTVRTLQIYTK